MPEHQKAVNLGRPDEDLHRQRRFRTQAPRPDKRLGRATMSGLDLRREFKPRRCAYDHGRRTECPPLSSAWAT